MNIDQALHVAAHLDDHEPADWSEAIGVLAAWVAARRPVMPKCQRGRTKVHAVRPVVYPDGSSALVAECAGITPEHHAGPLDLDQLPDFDPHDPDSCLTCCRHLPPELRPPLPERPKPERRPDRLAEYAVEAEPVEEGHAVVILFRLADPTDVVTTTPGSTMRELIDAIHRHRRPDPPEAEP